MILKMRKKMTSPGIEPGTSSYLVERSTNRTKSPYSKNLNINLKDEIINKTFIQNKNT